MPEAVIVATARSPIGRANKGSLMSLRTDEMAAQIVRALMAKVPSVKGSDIEDLIIGVGQPAGEAGFNLGRMVALLAGIPEAPGVVVNIASVLGERIIPGVVGYTSAKAGLLHMTRHLAVEWARHGIRVNAIAPGYIATDINRDYFASDSGQAMIKRIPQRRLGAAEDLTGPLLLLATDAGAHMTGAVVTVDGGHTINPL